MQIDPELLRLYRSTLNLEKEGKRGAYVRALMKAISEDIELADRYAKHNNVDFSTALECMRRTSVIKIHKEQV